PPYRAQTVIFTLFFREGGVGGEKGENHAFALIFPEKLFRLTPEEEVPIHGTERTKYISFRSILGKM
ncbi:MAG: hypothetical protein LBG58_06705, partial [Planctomycetaceae bacterium]|nr:hypothetical protein [Planctomycetaceae bacterium]